MALSELAALEAAYEVLQPLDAAGRRRALQWLSDALGTDTPLAAAPHAETSTTAASTTAASAPAKPARRRATPAVAARPRRAGRARKAAEPVPPAEQGRAYRRMPPADEVMEVYRQVGSVSAVAGHFDVPTHTAQGWARQLRRHGYAIGRNR